MTRDDQAQRVQAAYEVLAALGYGMSAHAVRSAVTAADAAARGGGVVSREVHEKLRDKHGRTLEAWCELTAEHEELRKATRWFLDTWVDCDRALTEGEWEDLDAAEVDLRRVLDGSPGTEEANDG